MNLLRKIQEATIDPQYQLADILRMCKILASRLKHSAFQEWVSHELDGYSLSTGQKLNRFKARVRKRARVKEKTA